MKPSGADHALASTRPVGSLGGVGTTVLSMLVVEFRTSGASRPPASIARWTIGSGSADGS